MSSNNLLNIHKNLIKKAIEELFYEEYLEIKSIEKNLYQLSFDDNISYTFNAHLRAFQSLDVEIDSIKKSSKDRELKLDAREFYLELKKTKSISDYIMSQFIEELNHTIFYDYKSSQKKDSIKDIINYSFNESNQYLTGHPKLLLNKGRLGFNTKEDLDFNSELSHGLQLTWIAISKSILIQKVANHSGSESYHNLITEIFKNYKIDENSFNIIPIHPWQWKNYIEFNFLDEIVDKKIIYLGEFGPKFWPQISQRTLSCNEIDVDIKLSTSILNTSSIRGISSQNILKLPDLSIAIEDILNKDYFFRELNTKCLKDLNVYHVPNKVYNDLEKGAYYFKELLTTIVRESVQSKIKKENNNSLSLHIASLFHYSKVDKRYLITELIEKSGIGPIHWMELYTKTVILPLYHLQVKYGIGLIAHGQNLILELDTFTPTALIFKDFNGDLRLASNSKLINHHDFNHLPKLPPEHLIHDLFTGHFITCLRYIARALEHDGLLAEDIFYETIKNQIKTYIQENIESLPFSHQNNLLKKEIEKILVNTIRFEIGYDHEKRPLPKLGKNLTSPLYDKEIEELISKNLTKRKNQECLEEKYEKNI